ncbi:hypothetical protein SCLCIDRAFT_1217884 [Scleroderma citrinum Foug A]|uniref:Uncharacterized protein n=1 Tax=Scleroderma citrinum Foug A TaxID=1036808 RepID=A0A0C3A3Q5_9AGAM|nr:hypothetical protein SCLCIDRAFT_1217884 [Scleroderma citrinum Foug A]
MIDDDREVSVDTDISYCWSFIEITKHVSHRHLIGIIWFHPCQRYIGLDQLSGNTGFSLEAS